MAKNSFTLFETLISIFILSIIIVGFSKTSSYDNFDEEYILLNEIENSFNTNTYNSNFSKSSKNIQIIKNENLEENLTINQIIYHNEKIKLVKYEVK